MSIPQPPAVVACYLVGRVKYEVVDTPFGKRMKAFWSGDNTGKGFPSPEYVNTSDIARVLREPDTFLLAWQEIHYVQDYVSIGGQPVMRWKELYKDHQHAINALLIAKLADQVQVQEQAQGGVSTLPPIRSYERILFQFGWDFQWEPVGEDDRLGAVVSDALQQKWSEQYECKILQEGPNLAQAGLPEARKVFTPVAAIPEPYKAVEKERRLDRLELMMERIVEKLGITDEPNISSRPGELDASLDEREAGGGLDQPDARPAGARVHQ